MTVTVSEVLERLADEILADDRRRQGDNSQEWKRYILLEDQLRLRMDREVLTDRLGTMENHGLYVRAYNPLFGKRKPKEPQGEKFDRRVPQGTSAPTAWSWELRGPAMDPQWPLRPHEDRQCHLTAGQRSRIRRALRNASGNTRLLHLTRAVLAEKYGVPIRVIMGLAR